VLRRRFEPSHPQEQLQGILAMTLGTQRSSLTYQQYGGQVRVLTLNYGEHLDSTLFRLKKGTELIIFILTFLHNFCWQIFESEWDIRLNVFFKYLKNPLISHCIFI
jgi:hypothetical protein